MSALLWEILGLILLLDLAIYALRERIPLFFARHGFFGGKSETLPDFSELDKWRD